VKTMGKKQDKFEADVIEMAHDLAMSKDEMMAVRGRYAKEVWPSFLRWMDAELERLYNGGLRASSERREDLLLALAEGFIGVMVSQAGLLAENLSGGKPDTAIRGLRVMTDMFVETAEDAEGVFKDLHKRKRKKG